MSDGLTPTPAPCPFVLLPEHRFVVILAVFHARAPDFLRMLMYLVRVDLGLGVFHKLPTQFE